MNYINELEKINKKQEECLKEIDNNYEDLKTKLIEAINQEYKSIEKILSKKPLCYVLTFNQLKENAFYNRTRRQSITRLSPEYNSKFYQIEIFIKYYSKYKDNDFIKLWEKSIKKGYLVDKNDRIFAVNTGETLYINQKLINAVNKVLFNKSF